VQIAGMQFHSNSPLLEVAMRDGNVISFNGLTGREQRRFLADWRTLEQKKVGRPRNADMWEAKFSGDGRTLVASHMEWVYVWDVESGAMRRKIRHPHHQGWRLALDPDGRTLATSDLRLERGENLG